MLKTSEKDITISKEFPEQPKRGKTKQQKYCTNQIPLIHQKVRNALVETKITKT